MNRLRFISQVLYRLKRRYGEPVEIVVRDSSVTNLQTGVKTVVVSNKHVRQAIVLPSVLKREFDYDLAFISNNKNFTYGGLFETELQQFIFDRKDLGNFEIKIGMYILFDNTRYDVKLVREFEDDSAYFVTAKQVTSADALEQFLVSELGMSDGVV